GTLILTATADEEGDGYWGLPWLLDQGIVRPDAAIVAEAAGISTDFEHVYTASRGYALVHISIRRPTGHSSLYDPRSPHAVAVACRLQTEIERDFRPTPQQHRAFSYGPTVIAGETFRGGEHLSHLPASAEFMLKAFPLPGCRKDSFLAEL